MYAGRFLGRDGLGITQEELETLMVDLVPHLEQAAGREFDGLPGQNRRRQVRDARRSGYDGDLARTRAISRGNRRKRACLQCVCIGIGSAFWTPRP